MCDSMPEEVILEILKRLPVKSVVKFRSVCKTWNSLVCDPTFISAHLQASLSNNTPFLLIDFGRENLSLHYDNDGFDEFKQLQFPEYYWLIDSCNGLICVYLLSNYRDYNFVLWNPSIQKYVSLPPVICEFVSSSVGFGFDSRSNDYKVFMVGRDKDHSWMEPYLFSLNENCWKRVTVVFPNYEFVDEWVLTFASGAVHWLGNQKRKDGGFSPVIWGFDLSAEVFSVINLPESLTGFSATDFSIMKYGESSIAVSIDPFDVDLHELWVMNKYGVVESWTKVLILHKVAPGLAPVLKVLGFKMNGEVLLKGHYAELASLDLSCQQMGDSLYLNCEQMEFHGFEFAFRLLSVNSYVESLVLLDKGVDVRSYSYVNHWNLRNHARYTGH